jgi:hypothetical protein
MFLPEKENRTSTKQHAKLFSPLHTYKNVYTKDIVGRFQIESQETILICVVHAQVVESVLFTYINGFFRHSNQNSLVEKRKVVGSCCFQLNK